MDLYEALENALSIVHEQSCMTESTENWRQQSDNSVCGIATNIVQTPALYRAKLELSSLDILRLSSIDIDV